MAGGFVVWDRKARIIVAPSPDGVFYTSAEADAVLARLRRKNGEEGFKRQNLERTAVNYD